MSRSFPTGNVELIPQKQKARTMSAINHPSYFNTSMPAPITELTVYIDSSGVKIDDPEGGRWWAGEDEEATIRAATDPEAKALEICEAGGGVWYN